MNMIYNFNINMCKFGLYFAISEPLILFLWPFVFNLLSLLGFKLGLNYYTLLSFTLFLMVIFNINHLDLLWSYISHITIYNIVKLLFYFLFSYCLLDMFIALDKPEQMSFIILSVCLFIEYLSYFIDKIKSEWKFILNNTNIWFTLFLFRRLYVYSTILLVIWLLYIIDLDFSNHYILPLFIESSYLKLMYIIYIDLFSDFFLWIGFTPPGSGSNNSLNNQSNHNPNPGRGPGEPSTIKYFDNPNSKKRNYNCPEYYKFYADTVNKELESDASKEFYAKNKINKYRADPDSSLLQHSALFDEKMKMRYEEELAKKRGNMLTGLTNPNGVTDNDRCIDRFIESSRNLNLDSSILNIFRSSQKNPVTYYDSKSNTYKNYYYMDKDKKKPYQFNCYHPNPLSLYDENETFLKLEPAKPLPDVSMLGNLKDDRIFTPLTKDHMNNFEHNSSNIFYKIYNEKGKIEYVPTRVRRIILKVIDN